MFLDLDVGSITEPLTGRSWDRTTILQHCEQRLAHLRGCGLRRSDRVFVHYGNTLEFFVDLLAIWRAGGCVVPVDPRLTAFEIGTLAQAAQPRFSLWHDAPPADAAGALAELGIRVICAADPATAPLPENPVGPAGRSPLLDQEAMILFTSGTTGSPKGVVHTHRSLLARWLGLRQSLGLAGFERTLCLLPTHFGHGLICNCLYPWLSGRHLYILPPFRPDIIVQLGRIIDQHDITFMSSVPTVWRLAPKTAAPPKKRSLQRVFCGSAPLSGHLWNEISQWTGAAQVVNAYGITETGSWLAGTTVSDTLPEDGLIGEAWGGIIKVMSCSDTESFARGAGACAPGESGFVWVHTPALMQGYLDNPQLTDQVVCCGWFFTGDIGLVDQRGVLYLRGRQREEINKGGMKVYPGDVDAVIERFEGALDVCTFACDDALLGENIGVAVVLKAGSEQAIGELYEWAARHLAQHQMPVRWYLLKEIPRTSRGKVNRASVAQACTAQTPVDRRALLARR